MRSRPASHARAAGRFCSASRTNAPRVRRASAIPDQRSAKARVFSPAKGTRLPIRLQPPCPVFRITNYHSLLTNRGIVAVTFRYILYSKMNMNRNRRNPLKTKDPCTLYSIIKRVLTKPSKELLDGHSTHRNTACDPRLPLRAVGGILCLLLPRSVQSKVPSRFACRPIQRQRRKVPTASRCSPRPGRFCC